VERSKSDIEIEVKMNTKQLAELYKRIDRLECKWDALIRRLEGVARHPEDEGWFD
jgi:hypothetical protein